MLEYWLVLPRRRKWSRSLNQKYQRLLSIFHIAAWLTARESAKRPSSISFSSRKQIRFHLHFARRLSVGQVKHFQLAALADGLFKKSKQRRLRCVELEGRNLGINLSRL